MMLQGSLDFFKVHLGYDIVKSVACRTFKKSLEQK